MSPNSKILVTPRSIAGTSNPAIERLVASGYTPVFPDDRSALPTLETQLEFAPEIVGYLAGVERIGEEFLAQAHNLRVISRNGVGVDSVDLEAAERFGVQVKNAPGVNARGVAELVIALIFEFARGVTQQSESLRMGKWTRTLGFEVENKTIGIVGFGHIGRLVAELAAGVGMNVLVHDPFLDGNGSKEQVVSLEVLLSRADIVSLHCPPSENPLISERAIRLMKEGSILINTARAGLVDSAAAFVALKSDHLRGWATDVFDSEPPTFDEKFEHSGFLPTPHIGGYTKESVDRALDLAVSNLLEVLGNRAR